MNITNIFKAGSIVLLAFLSFTFNANAQRGKKKADKETVAWRYELEAVATGVSGTYQVKVWSYSRNVETAMEQAKKNAVHGIIFKGFPDKGDVKGQKPIATNPNIDEQNKDFFEEFFKTGGGDYMKFVTLANNGQIAPQDRIKISKKEYKIGIVVSVNKSELRKYLEKAGIVRGLSDGF
ncbi:MAG: hypothetical protein CL844_04340 [Crocinitomicaceae bacterium]|nr:hypothetical protein [Crocinitomicaceae bacterium]|tara:strand:- start:5707 stop:6243 length:537 start_codon:yes stop_codon:yes gene_type:complete